MKIKIDQHIEAPKGCYDCPLRDYISQEGAYCSHPDAPSGYGNMLYIDYKRGKSNTPEWCPIRKHLKSYT